MKYSSKLNYPATLMLLACCSQYRQLGPEPMSFQIIVCILCQWPEGDLGAIPIKSYVVINVMRKKRSASVWLNGFNISLSTTEKQTNKFEVNPNAYWNISTVMWKATVISFSAFSSYVVPDEIKREIFELTFKISHLGETVNLPYWVLTGTKSRSIVKIHDKFRAIMVTTGYSPAKTVSPSGKQNKQGNVTSLI